MIDIDRVIQMAWEDRTPFEALKIQFGLKESDVKALMRKNLKPSSYVLWRKRAESNNLKHSLKRNPEIDRFKCSRQKAISSNKISKKN